MVLLRSIRIIADIADDRLMNTAFRPMLGMSRILKGWWRCIVIAGLLNRSTLGRMRQLMICETFLTYQ